jgi:LCP family protein required for cell wall assembly
MSKKPQIEPTGKKPSKLRKILLSIFIPLGVIIAIVVGLALHYLNITNRFLNAIQPQFPEYVEYNLIAPKSNSGPRNDGERISYLATDIYTLDVARTIHEDLSATAADPADPTTLSLDLLANRPRLALISDDFLLLYESNLSDFYEQITVIERVRVNITQPAISTPELDITRPFVVYISGIDVRDGSLPFAALSDVNILLVINPKTYAVTSVNTPRDYYIQLHGTTGLRSNLNHAGMFGAEMSMHTLEDLYEIQIPYYVRLNFEALIKIIDLIGGVDVYSDQTFSANHEGVVYNFTKGNNHLDGRSALAYARERKNTGGDEVRGRHQQQIIEAVMKKALTPSLLTRYGETLDAISGAIQTNIPPAAIRDLAFSQMNNMSKWSFLSLAVTGRSDQNQPTYVMGNHPQWVMWPDMDSVDVARHALREALGE